VHARHPEGSGLNARFAYGAVQGVTWLLALGPILLLITIILPLCHQINKGINNIINIINLEYFGYIIGSKLTIIILSIYFLMNGNIFNYSLASEQYKWNCGWFGCDSAYAIPPAPPGNISTITGEPIFIQSYINAYNTAFNQPNNNYQAALNKYQDFNPGNTNSNFIPGTFGSREEYIGSISNQQSNIIIDKLKDNLNAYLGTPYLFISAGSGGGSGFMYLDWVIVTYGVPYVVAIS